MSCKSSSNCCSKFSCILKILGFVSIVGSIIIWATAKGPTPESIAHAERFGIFVGLWAPTFFALAGMYKPCGCSAKSGCCSADGQSCDEGKSTGGSCCQK